MKNNTLIIAALTILSTTACKKSKNDCDNATVKFVNISAATFTVELSKINESNPSFTTPAISFNVAASSTVEKSIPAGARFVRWKDCQGSPCYVTNQNSVEYKGCTKYEEVPGTISASDFRYKKNFTPLENQAVTDKIMQLTPFAYEYNFAAFPSLKAPDGFTYGFVAQELEKVFPATVIQDKEGYRSVNYTALVPVLTAVIQQQQQEIQSLKERLTKLELQP